MRGGGGVGSEVLFKRRKPDMVEPIYEKCRHLSDIMLLRGSLFALYELGHAMRKRVFGHMRTNEGQNQLVHPHNLIRAFPVH